MIGSMIDMNNHAAELLAYVLSPADYSANTEELKQLIYDNPHCSRVIQAFKESGVPRIGLQQFKNLLSSLAVVSSRMQLAGLLADPKEFEKMTNGTNFQRARTSITSAT